MDASVLVQKVESSDYRHVNMVVWMVLAPIMVRVTGFWKWFCKRDSDPDPETWAQGVSARTKTIAQEPNGDSSDI